MDSAATLIISRLDALERNREADKSEAKTDRHGFRNEIVDKIGEVELRVMKLERAEAAAVPTSENSWMKAALGVEAAIISWLAYMAFGGHK